MTRFLMMVLICLSGHYDLLYKQEDLVETANSDPNVKVSSNAPGRSATIVRTVNVLPEPFFQTDEMFHGLPGFDPDARFLSPDAMAVPINHDLKTLQPFEVQWQADSFGDNHNPWLPFSNMRPNITSYLDQCLEMEATFPQQDHYNSQPVFEAPATPCSIPLQSQPTYNLGSSISQRPISNSQTLSDQSQQENLKWTPRTTEQQDYDERNANSKAGVSPYAL